MSVILLKENIVKTKTRSFLFISDTYAQKKIKSPKMAKWQISVQSRIGKLNKLGLLLLQFTNTGYEQVLKY